MARGGTQREMEVSPTEVQRYLKGMRYPARKEDLIEQARGLKAPAKVIQVIERFPDQEFRGPTDVSRAIGGLS